MARSHSSSATPLIIQAEEADCGPVCLGIVLAHRGVSVPVATLRSACGASRDGSSAADLIRVAAAHGFDARGIRINIAADPETVLRVIEKPAIVVLRGSHFVVLERVGDDHTVAINDPARGRDVRPIAEFLAEFSGVILLITGKATGPAPPRRRPWVSTCIRWLAPARGTVALVVLAGLGLGLLGASEGVLLARAGVAVAAGQPGRIGVLAALAAGIALLASALAHGQRRLLNAVPPTVSAHRSRELLETILTVPGSFLQRRPLAALMTQIQFVKTAAVVLPHRVVPLLSSVALLLPLGTALALLSPSALGLAAAGAAAAAALRAAGDRRAAPAQLMLTGEFAHCSGLARAALSRRAAMHAEASDADLFADLCARLDRDRRTRDSVAARLRPWHPAATAVELVVSVGGCGLLAAMAFASGSPSAVGALAVVGPFLVHVRSAIDLLRELPEFIARFAVLDDLLTAPREPRYLGIAGRAHTRRLRGGIELVGLAAGYTSNRSPLLDGMSVRIEPGRRVVLLGAPGAGASTLLRVLVGALDPLRGRVLFDDLPVAEIPRAVLRRSLGYVPQTPCLFPGTVADNVTLFDDSIAGDAVARALRDACLEDVIALRGGLRSAVVAPDGQNLAGGERWRLALARALVQDPSVLVLDEPAGRVDPALAARIDGALRRRGATTVIATRDASFAGPHDLVLVLKGRRLVPRPVPR